MFQFDCRYIYIYMISVVNGCMDIESGSGLETSEPDKEESGADEDDEDPTHHETNGISDGI